MHSGFRIPWVVSGPVYSSGSNNVVARMTTTPNCDSDQHLLKFWEIESVSETRHLTLDERRCEGHFDSSTKRNEDGRFVVQMPFKDGPHNLGLSKANAIVLGVALMKFWEIESVPETRHLTLDERRCEEHFDSTTKRNEDGRFVVQMPFKDGPHNLGLPKANAIVLGVALKRRRRNSRQS